jgi:hypothetical protein
VKLDTDVLFGDELEALPDVAVAAFLMAWGWAARQHERGFFRTERVLKEHLGPRRSRGIPALYRAGLLYRTTDGRVEAVGYAEMHEADAAVPERMQRLRARRKAVRAAIDATSGEQGASSFNRNGGYGGSAPFNRNESHRSTRYPEPETLDPDSSIDLRVDPSAPEAPVNGHNPHNDESTEIGALAWLTRFFGQPPTELQMERVREVAERAELGRRHDDGGWGWVLDRFEHRRDKQDPIDHLFEVDKRWQLKERAS